MTDLLALADRVEKLTKADPQVDALVWCAVFAPSGAYVEQSRFNGAWCIYHGTDRHDHPRLWEASNCRVQPVTGSFDAAMTLIPGGYPIETLSWWPSVPAGYESERRCRLAILELGRDGFAGLKRFRADAATPAIALTAAALRARAKATEGSAES